MQLDDYSCFGHIFVLVLIYRYIQDAFDVPLVIQMTDDEKFLWKVIFIVSKNYS